MSLEVREVRTILTAKNQTERPFTTVQTGLTGISRAAAFAGVSLGSIGLAALAREMVTTADKFQKLDDMLTTVTGSSRDASVAMSWLTDFAKETPYRLEEVINAFVKMKSLGLDASEAALRSYGNTASAMGKDLNQMIEAVADASVGEFERLKEFGIKANKEGDQVKLTFQGITTTVRNNSQEITSYLQGIGNNQFATGMSSQLDNIGTALSNLSAGWDEFMVALGDTGAIDLATDGIIGLTHSLENFSNSLKILKAYKDDQITFWEFLTAGPEGSKELLERIASKGTELAQLENHVKELKAHKQGNIWWSQAEEAELQQALQALEYYKLSLGDVARLKAAAQHSVFTGEDGAASGTPNPNTVALGIAAGNATDPDMWLKRVGLDAEAQERAKTAYFEQRDWMIAQDIEAGNLMQDMWLQQAEGRAEANMRGLEMINAQEEWAAQQRFTIDQNMFQAKLGLTGSMLDALAILTGNKNKAIFAAQKIFGIASAVAAAYQAKALALANPPGPPATIPMSIAAFKMGMFSAAGIAATNLASMVTSFSGSDSPGYGGGTPNSPVVTQPTVPQQEITISLKSEIHGIVDERLVETTLVPMLNEAGTRNVRIEYA
ncbi:tape measure protein [Desulfuromonas sp. KJ2020]|uniref:tape measure protein n=1 Tax=Desulfuromonas sp. KJ2020 TaxID=2919173 RepID=UPI0020A7A032|nr:tape measure protein [Desulfuromonas sp. KJ2020]MCP3177310.1 tape measure protein [Desulfuromonas sp. KJ2020]